MKKILLLLTAFFFQSTLFASTYSLNVKVDNLKNKKGDLIVLLYNKVGSIPDEKLTKFFKKKTIPLNSTSAEVTFDDLSKGDYAVVVVHDENKDHKIDKGLFLPKEGVGFSNFKSISPLNKPNFKRASFLLDKDLTKQIKVIYF